MSAEVEEASPDISKPEEVTRFMSRRTIQTSSGSGGGNPAFPRRRRGAFNSPVCSNPSPASAIRVSV